MPNKYGIPTDTELRIRARDGRCVYCGKAFSQDCRGNEATIEHLNEKPAFYWKLGLKEVGLAICCGSCNSSRRNKTLREWFRTPYCTNRTIPINEETVAEAVKAYLRRENLSADRIEADPAEPS